MQSWLVPYEPTVLAMLAVATLFIVQLLVGDFAGIRAKHVPGSPVTADHGNFLFRAVRAHANTNESIAAFILLVLIGILASASPNWINASAWAYVAGRMGHMLCYYADLRLARSVMFGIGLLALLSLLLAGFSAVL